MHSDAFFISLVTNNATKIGKTGNTMFSFIYTVLREQTSKPINDVKMKVSLLLLAALSVALLLHAFHQSQASELSQLLEDEIQELKDEIEKRGNRKPCGFTWRCKRRRSRRGSKFWGKRVREINIAFIVIILVSYQAQKLTRITIFTNTCTLRLLCFAILSFREFPKTVLIWQTTYWQGYSFSKN